MAKVESSIVINRPVANVFAYFNDPQKGPQWQGGLVETKQLTPGPVGVGTKFQDTRNFLGQKLVTTYEITQFEPNKKVAFKSSGGPVAYVGTFAFEAAGSGTKVTVNFDLQPGGFFKLAEGMVASSAQKQNDADLAKMKQLLESQK